MSNLEVGMYVRTKDGVIGKLINKNYVGYGDFIIDTLYYEFDEIIDKWTCTINKYNVVKASYNIIDLIEVGDYVNGEIVTKVSLDNIECNYIEISYTYNRRGIRNKDIKSIVTKEQFESMKYEVGDSNV